LLELVCWGCLLFLAQGTALGEIFFDLVILLPVLGPIPVISSEV
jgi:hypothetical protein